MLAKSIVRVHKVLPLPARIFSPLALVLAIAGFICFTHQDLWCGFWLFAAAGVSLVTSRVLVIAEGNLAFGPIREASSRAVKFLLIFSYFWMDFETLGLGMGPWVALALFFSSFPILSIWSDNVEEYIELFGRRISLLIALSVPLFAMYSEHGAGYAMIALVGFGILTAVYRLFCEFDAKS